VFIEEAEMVAGHVGKELVESIGLCSIAMAEIWPVTRVNSTNVLDEGLMIGEVGRRMNSKVKSVEQGAYGK
jgi:hypothetical protein